MEIIKGLTNEAYRAMDGLSASDIKALLANPYKFKQGIKRPASIAQNIGSAVHSLIQFHGLFASLLSQFRLSHYQ